ncbi:hypothetical protein QO002_005665 [Pararhizobium capsulatum DSM 1112]|uniref:Pepco domain-containing protein n=1 Tax=Pararhizobium capsulatum DSM 1112 TaxID=1121113 RepID=A0ABU0BYY3_9HYPH|nr:hypothetical protein [Pararhizobium capsulatum]MDQ0323459.1 hypothetical protein [Pararhizobium capsulatum DSM 1112]
MSLNRRISVLTEVDMESADGVRSGEDVGGGFGAIRDRGFFKIVHLSADDLRDQVTNLLEVVQHVFDQSFTNASLSLDQLELSVEISSEGQINILGSGGKVAGRGGIKLIFKKDKQKEII